MERKSSVVSATALMVALNFIKPALGIFLLPLYLNVLTGPEYGLYTLMVAVSGIVNIAGTLRINSSMTTFYWDYNHDENLTKKYLSQLFSFSLFLGIICFGFLLLCGPLLFEIIFKDESVTFYPYGLIVIISALVSATNSVYFIYLKNKKQFAKLSYILLTQIILAVIIQIVLILGFKKGVYGLLLGVMIPYSLTFIYIILQEKGIINFKFDWSMIKPSMKYSIALIPYLLIYWLSSTGDRIILENYLNLKVVGQYALLMTIAGMLFLVADSVMNGIRPFLYESFQRGGNHSGKYAQKLIKFYMAANLLAAGGILLIGHNLSFVTKEETFIAAIPYFTLATCIVFLRSYLLLFNMQLNYTKSSRVISVISIFSLVVLLYLYHVLSGKYGLEGVLLAGIIAGFASSIVFFFVAQRKLKMNYNLIDIWFIPFISFILLFMVHYYLDIDIRLKGLIQFFISILAVIFVLRGNFIDIIALVKKKEISIE